ncbi:methyltransferase [Treponema sp.]|uniref:methyltransferase n=1 Tax=Treponema sp. TaxID=166 RepID=UPI00257B0479|nr:methyltransferase [Treponema sp.]MBE6354982.1 class I SAM-dependent methyltransferase [Treponema sp.]
MDKALYNDDTFKDDKIRAVDAKFEAQKIAFSPLTFQAVRALIETGLLQMIEDAGDEGISRTQLAEKSKISEYGVGVLCEMALGMDVLKFSKDTTDFHNEKFVLGKTGWMLLEDDLTKANFNFTNDICYQGAWALLDSIKNSKPEGLKVFGTQWTTIYEALSTLPERAKKSWFDFDHFYSDIAFPEALPIVYAKKPKHLIDIGGNTAKWAIASCKFDSDVHVTIVDLPGQTAVAEKNAAAAGFADRISTCAGNILREETKLPSKPDAVWMSQFLDCFSLHQISKIAKKVYEAADENTNVYVLEPLWDKQHFTASSYSLQATSLYFTCMANGNSKMYRFQELVDAIEESGLELKTAHHNLGSNCYSLLVFNKKK